MLGYTPTACAVLLLMAGTLADFQRSAPSSFVRTATAASAGSARPMTLPEPGRDDAAPTRIDRALNLTDPTGTFLMEHATLTIERWVSGRADSVLFHYADNPTGNAAGTGGWRLEPNTVTWIQVTAPMPRTMERPRNSSAAVSAAGRRFDVTFRMTAFVEPNVDSIVVRTAITDNRGLVAAEDHSLIFVRSTTVPTSGIAPANRAGAGRTPGH